MFFFRSSDSKYLRGPVGRLPVGWTWAHHHFKVKNVCHRFGRALVYTVQYSAKGLRWTSFFCWPFVIVFYVLISICLWYLLTCCPPSAFTTFFSHQLPILEFGSSRRQWSSVLILFSSLPVPASLRFPAWRKNCSLTSSSSFFYQMTFVYCNHNMISISASVIHVPI